jgi:hypothetical protein
LPGDTLKPTSDACVCILGFAPARGPKARGSPCIPPLIYAVSPLGLAQSPRQLLRMRTCVVSPWVQEDAAAAVKGPYALSHPAHKGSLHHASQLPVKGNRFGWQGQHTTCSTMTQKKASWGWGQSAEVHTYHQHPAVKQPSDNDVSTKDGAVRMKGSHKSPRTRGK